MSFLKDIMIIVTPVTNYVSTGILNSLNGIQETFKFFIKDKKKKSNKNLLVTQIQVLNDP